MLTEGKLNSVVERYKQGDENALKKLVNLFLPIIHNQSDSIWYRIEKETDFECRCILKIKNALANYDPTRDKLRNLVINIIMKEKFDFLVRRKRKFGYVFSLDGPEYTDDEGNEITLEVQDVLADVENSIIEQETIKEKVALLAKGDSRRVAILKAWIDGETNDLKLAKELAETFPATAESGHRRFIQRFRIECQKRLTNAV